MNTFPFTVLLFDAFYIALSISQFYTCNALHLRKAFLKLTIPHFKTHILSSNENVLLQNSMFCKIWSNIIFECAKAVFVVSASFTPTVFQYLF